MNCYYCDSLMVKDDTDTINKNSKDIYYNCTKCQASCITKIRMGIKVEENWHLELLGKIYEKRIDFIK